MQLPSLTLGTITKAMHAQHAHAVPAHDAAHDMWLVKAPLDPPTGGLQRAASLAYSDHRLSCTPSSGGTSSGLSGSICCGGSSRQHG